MKKIINSYYFKLVISAMFAGLIMALASFELIVAKSLNLYYVGGFVQGFGLVAIIFLGLELYNTKLTSIFEKENKLKTLLNLLIVLIINILTIVAVAVLCRLLTNDKPDLVKSAKEIAEMRVITVGDSAGKEWYDALIASLLCGFIVAIGINIYNRLKSGVMKFITIIFAVGIYVACGFEQIMTNTFYIIFANMLNGYTFLDLFIVLLGNTIASILVYFGFKLLLPISKEINQ